MLARSKKQFGEVCALGVVEKYELAILRFSYVQKIHFYEYFFWR